MKHSASRFIARALLPVAAALVALGTLCSPAGLSTASAQAPAPPPEMVDWKVDRTPNGFDGYWEFSPQVSVYVNLYRRDNGANVASVDLGTGFPRGSGVYRYSTNLSSPSVKPDLEYTLDVIAENLSDPSVSSRFTFIVPDYSEGGGGGLFSGATGWLRGIRDALDPMDWIGRLFSFTVATVGRGINQFLCDLLSWATGQTPQTCIP